METTIRKSDIITAMADPDEWVLWIVYQAKDGTRTARFISPYKFNKDGNLVALCLARQGVRCFDLHRIEYMVLKPAGTVLMPSTLVML